MCFIWSLSRLINFKTQFQTFKVETEPLSGISIMKVPQCYFLHYKELLNLFPSSAGWKSFLASVSRWSQQHQVCYRSSSIYLGSCQRQASEQTVTCAAVSCLAGESPEIGVWQRSDDVTAQQEHICSDPCVTRNRWKQCYIEINTAKADKIHSLTS